MQHALGGSGRARELVDVGLGLVCAHGHVAEATEEILPECLGEDVGLVVRSGDPLDVDVLPLDVVAQEVMTDVNVLRACMMLIIRSDRYC